jgi:hypothetical protein
MNWTDEEGSDRDLVKGTIVAFDWRDRKSTKIVSVVSVRPRFERNTSRIQVRSLTP